LVLRRESNHNLIAGLSTIVDSSMADEVLVPAGGTVHPYSSENLGTSQTCFQAADAELLREYVAETMPRRLVEAIRAALADGGEGAATLEYLALRHLDPKGRGTVLDTLGLREDQCDSLDDVGHCGSGDIVVSLARGLERGAFGPGDSVVLASSGIGFNYAAALLRWGRQ
jgi:3-oxoacyl-[acyl-carrier-protein] synthase-3